MYNKVDSTWRDDEGRVSSLLMTTTTTTPKKKKVDLVAGMLISEWGGW